MAALSGGAMLFASLVALPWALAKAQGPGVHGTEFVDVVPSEELRGTQAVMVSGTGFPGGASLAVTECLRVATGQDDCDLSTLDLGVTARADGAFGPVRFVVHPAIRVGSRTGSVRCGADGCSIGVGTLDATYGGSHCVGFGGDCKPPPPQTTTPSSLPSPQGSSPSSQGSTAAASGAGGGGSNGALIGGIVVGAVVVVALVTLALVRRRSGG
ncbi:MAG: neocarzinostatin apoprotein domain-containing protein [Actinomycetota bacterium]